MGKRVWLSFCLQTENSFEVWGYKYVRGSSSVQELKDSVVWGAGNEKLYGNNMG